MNGTKRMLAMAATVFASCLLMGDGALSDEETKRRIADFVTLPSRLCGRAHVDFMREFRERKLTNRSWFDGDTNRLARLIAELAMTNDMRVSSMMVDALGEYGTIAQLPFLYSCATNPIIGDRAVKTILSIEGVSSNSISVVHDYLFQTNWFPFPKAEDRSRVCEDLVSLVYATSSLSTYRPDVYSMALDFESNVNLVPNVLDAKLLSVVEGYRYSRCRLAALRSAKARIDAELEGVESSGYEVWRRTYCYNFQTNYLDKAISELVAYPEANLHD